MSDPSSGDDELVTMVVDQERCIGSGMCEMLAESVFLLDEDTNVAVVLAGSKLDLKTAREVVDRCPSSAITIGEPGSTPT